MDDSTPTVTQTTASPPPAQHGVMARALASAAVFGTLGQYIGHRLGRDISNKVAEPLLRWSMGSFWALLAAYSSLKAAAMERGETITETPEAAKTAPPKAPAEIFKPSEKTPLSLIELDTLKDHGQVQATTQEQRAQK